ncbi:MAG TPA: TRAP transporter small permease [Burkholderiaceae bacterium]|nr:TRAP transporter small permease [Burkholderiaceae bacterium]
MNAWARLMRACGGAAAAILGAVVVLVCWDVFARNLGAKSLPWIVEVTEYALPLATFLAAPWLMHRYEHVRLDLLSTSLSPANMARIERIAAAVCLVVSLVIVWYSLAVILDTRKVGALVIKSLVFPEWWLFVPVPICFLLLAGECARRLVFPPPPTPAAVDGGVVPPVGDGSSPR